MPYGKIVVIKRGGGDGTEFPLTATCLFGRKQDCDIRIQLPHVSKEHCRVELNENKEVVLTNMSSVNPTQVNGAELQQAERLKHGDIITIIDRSFRFEYPSKQTPKKSSVSGKADTLQVLHEQLRTPGENKTDTFTGPRLKDGASNDNIQRSLEKTVEVESKGEDETPQHSKVDSPFSDLYQMIKTSLETPVKPTGHPPQTPATKTPTPKPTPGRITKVVVARGPAAPETLCTPAKVEVKSQPLIPAKSPKKFREVTAAPIAEDVSSSFVLQQTPNTAAHPKETPKKQRLSLPALAVTVSATTEAPSTQELSAKAEEPKTPGRRKSKEAMPATPAAGEEQPEPTPVACCAAPPVPSPRVSPRSVEKKSKALSLLRELEAKAAAKETLAQKKRELEAAASPRVMRKRVSFGGHLSPELFDKRLPPSSPLQKGATPRRSLGHAAPKQSLLRRASVIGLIKESDEPTSTKAKSPKAKTPSPGRKSPKVASGNPSPTVSGRFSVSRIDTPSPVAGQDAAPPTAPLRRKSISRKTPKSALKNAAEVLRRRSGVSRASLKIKNSWVDVVKFGQTKTQVVAPARRQVAAQKVKKAVVAQPKTPARRNIKEHVTTGHADSPATIVVGKAFNKRAVQLTGAAPKLVHNIALLKKKNLKLDEDLTGMADIFSTPVNTRMRKSDLSAKTAVETPCSALSVSAVEMSVMNTPEESGEMAVSPIVLGSTSKPRAFNTEAVQRLLLSEGEDSSFSADAPTLEDPIQEVHTVLAPPTNKQEAESIGNLGEKLMKTPKQKPLHPDCLSAVKRVMKTPRQKTEPIEDLRGKLLKTPKQKPVQPDGLSAVKRVMKTPRQKTEPIEDLRGKLLKTPRVQKVSGEMDLNGVKQLLETPKPSQKPVSVAPEVIIEETQPATLQETITITPIVKEVVVEETIAPIEEEVVVEEAISPIEEEVVVEETIAPIEKMAEETIAPIEKVVVEETIAPIEKLVVEETIAPIEKFVVVEETIAPTKEVMVAQTLATPEVKMAPVEEMVAEATLVTPAEEKVAEEAPLASSEETIALTEEVVEETIAPIEESLIDESLATPEETIAPTEEVVVEETIAPTEEVVVEETISPTEEVVVEETIAPIEEVMIDELTENIENRHAGTAVTAPDMETEPIATVTPAAEEPEQVIAVETAQETKPAEEPEQIIAMETAPETAPVELEEPAPTPTPARARRGRPAAQKKIPGLRGKTVETENVEEPAVASLAEETSLKPKRGRNAKQAPAVEVVPETTTEEEETSNSAPLTDAAAAVPPPAKTQTRKGRNGRQVQEQPSVTPKPEEEEQAPTVNVEKPRRGRKATKQEEKVSEETVPEEEVPEEKVSEQSTVEEEVAEEAPLSAIAVKPRRGRKAIQEAAPEPIVVEEVSTEEPAQAPVRAKRGRQTKAKPEEEKVEPEVGIPVAPEAVLKQATAKRTRKTKQGSVEKTASEELNRVVVVEEEEEVVKATVAPSKTRGRRGKPQEEEVEEEQMKATVAPSKTRGRRGKQVEVVMEEEEQPPAELAGATETVAALAEKPRRGGRQTNAEEAVEAVTTAPPSAAKVQTAEKPKRGGRRAKAEQQVVLEKEEEQVEDQESTSAPVVEQPEKVVKSTRVKRAAVTVTVPAAAPVKRGRRGAVAAEPSAPTVARGKAGKRSAAETVEVPTVEPAAAEDQEDQGEKVLPKKGRVSKKTKPTPVAVPTEDGETSEAVNRKDLPVTYGVPTPVAPVKATRGQKATIARETETAVAALVVAVKRKVSRTQSKAEEAPPSELSLPVKRTRRAAKLS